MPKPNDPLSAAPAAKPADKPVSSLTDLQQIAAEQQKVHEAERQATAPDPEKTDAKLIDLVGTQYVAKGMPTDGPKVTITGMVGANESFSPKPAFRVEHGGVASIHPCTIFLRDFVQVPPEK